MFLLKLLFKNAFRHKLRAWLTILSITIAILAFGLLRTVIDAWYVGVERASANRLVTRNAVSMTFSLPLSYREKIAQVAGVTQVSIGNWFGGIYIDEKNFFPNFAVEPRSYFALYPEYVFTPGQREAFFRDRKGFRGGAEARGAVRMEDRRHGHAQGDHLSRQLGVRAPRHLRRQGRERGRACILLSLGLPEREPQDRPRRPGPTR